MLSVLDLVDELVAEKAKFFPGLLEEYDRITPLSVTAEETPDFIADKKVGTSLTGLVWNQTKLNLSLPTQIFGVVPLREGHEALGLPRYHTAHIFRTFTLIKNGTLNITRLPVSLSQDLFTRLKALKVVRGDWEDGKVFQLDLAKLPIVHFSLGKELLSAADICRQSMLELTLKAEAKVLKWLLANESAKDVKFKADGETLTEEQEAFLAAHHIFDGAFKPPVVSKKVQDSYAAKEFVLKIQGFSSLPPVEKVVDKVEKELKLTKADSLIAHGLETFLPKLAVLTPEDKKTWLKATLAEVNLQAFRLRQDIQRTKFLVIHGDKWFTEFQGMDKNAPGLALVVGGISFELLLQDELVEC